MTAPLVDRLLAFGYDYLLISLYLVALSGVAFGIMTHADPAAWSHFFSSPLRADLVAFITAVLPVTLYFAWMESSYRQASWGKSRRHLIVVSCSGGRMSFGLALARAAIKMLPWQLAHTCLFNIPGWPMQPGTPPAWVTFGLVFVWVLVGIYLGSAFVGSKRAMFYDRVLGTAVRLLPGNPVDCRTPSER